MEIRKTITLIGLMGAGKTTVGIFLAKRLGIDFVDSDRVIEENAGLTIAEIFARDGEEFFRKVEAKTISDILARQNPVVLATGGGAFMQEETRELIKQNSTSIWLRADLPTLVERVEHNNNRPLLNGKDKAEVLQNLINVRYPIYGQADIVVDTNVNSKHLIADKIMEKLEQKWKD
jgi:shikimate kinase